MPNPLPRPPKKTAKSFMTSLYRSLSEPTRKTVENTKRAAKTKTYIKVNFLVSLASLNDLSSSFSAISIILSVYVFR
jgi:hypothetical protein